jgi:hypothetical protein
MKVCFHPSYQQQFLSVINNCKLTSHSFIFTIATGKKGQMVREYGEITVWRQKQVCR